LTQKFLGNWTIAGAIVKPYDPDTAVDPTFAGLTVSPGQVQAGSTGLEGQASETPQLQGKLAYEKDLWGKAAFYGRPRAFTAQVTGGWQRTRYRANFANQNITAGPQGINTFTFGQNAYGITNVIQRDQQYLDPWMVQGTLFIPVIPTHSANLAGTASLTAQWFIGQGVAFVGGGRDQDSSWLKFIGRDSLGRNLFYDRRLTNQYGGYLQGQYWFNNQWFVNLTWGMIRDYGISQSRDPQAITPGNPAGYVYATSGSTATSNGNDRVKLWQEYAMTLWYRPVEALKFGLQYSYERTDFLQKLNNPTLVAGSPQNSNGATNFGESHRVQFIAVMFY
jgi:hypothetical protein